MEAAIKRRQDLADWTAVGVEGYRRNAESDHEL
jgi:hypothetical protein